MSPTPEQLLSLVPESLQQTVANYWLDWSAAADNDAFPRLSKTKAKMVAELAAAMMPTGLAPHMATTRGMHAVSAKLWFGV